MIKDVHDYSIEALLLSNRGVYYTIPKYQRAYTWGVREWEALYDDISDNNTGYFMGSIICISQGDSIKPNLEVIDGQQRITTLCLLLAAIYKQLKEYESHFSQGQSDELTLLRCSLKSSDSPNKIKLVPQEQSNNLVDFNYLMKEVGLREGHSGDNKNFSRRKIARCYNYYFNRIAQEIEGKNSEDAISFIFNQYNKVKSAILVKIEVKSHSDAYVLFESLNNSGIPLTAIDLMKNLIMSRAENHNLTVEDCFEQWKQLLEYLSDDYAIQERFFRQYYNAFKHQLNEPFRSDNNRKKDPLGAVATRSNLLNIFQRLIEKNLPSFLNDVLCCGKIFARLILNDECGTIYRKALVDLDHIQGAPSYMLLMYLIKNQDELKVTDEQINQLVQFLCKYFVRRNLTDYPGTRKLTRMFMTIISMIEDENVKGNEVVKLIETAMTNSEYCASNELFRERLEGNMYEDNRGVTRYILCKCAEAAMTKETWKDLWERNENKKAFEWTIEHIFPEGNNIPDDWVKMIANGDKALANQYLEEYTHKIGNLTITRFNSNLGNKSFTEKRDLKDKDGRFIGYKNGLGINSDIATKDSWTVEDIQTRTNELVDKLMEDYQLP